MPYVIKAQGYDPSPVIATKAEAVAAIRFAVRQDVVSCRRKFGRALVVTSENMWEVRPIKDFHGPLWSRYTLHRI